MNKLEAQNAMREGKKVTHPTYFTEEEWATTEHNPNGSGRRRVLTEDGVKCDWDEWWKYRSAPGFETGWTLWHATREEEIDNASRRWIDSCGDSEIRRMYGHHMRSFIAGANWTENNPRIELDRIPENKLLIVQNEELKRQLEDVITERDQLKSAALELAAHSNV